MKNTPEIRFKGFTDVWVQRRLGEVADIIGGGTPDTAIMEYWNGDIDWYSPFEIGEQLFLADSQKKITALGLKRSSAKILPIGTVLFTSRAGIGNTAILAKEGATNQGFQSIVPFLNLLDTYFIFSRTHELKRYGEINGAGSTFVEVSGKQMSNMPILIPSFYEQTSIGNFFRTLDKTITLYKRKLDNLKLLKKAYLQHMFPQDGETVPKVRFAGFKGDWEEAKLGDIAEFKNGMNFSKEAMGHGFPFVNLQNIFGKTIVDISSLGLAESNEQQRKEYSLKKGDILFIRSSVKPEGVGEAAIIPCDLIDTTYSGFIIRCRIAGNFNDAFKQFLFTTGYFRNQMLNNATTSANTNINQDSLSKMFIRFPIKEEQSAIGNFLRNLDEQIATQQTKLNNLKLLKSAYLQKMFV